MATTHDVLNGDFADRYPDHVPIAAVMVVEAIAPDGEPVLIHICPEDVPIWKAIGMLDVTRGDMLADCREEDG